MAGRNRQAGYNLIETLIGSVVFLLIMGAVYGLQQVSLDIYGKAGDSSTMQQVARVALDRMAQDLRMAGYASAKLSDPVVIATNDTVSVHADTGEKDPATGALLGPVYITYGLRDCNGTLGNTLYRNVSTTTYCGGEAIATNVASLQFTYFEGNNVVLPYPTPDPPTYSLDDQGAVTGSGTPTAPAVGSQRSQVRQIKVALTLSNGLSQHPQRFTATTEVTLRNLTP